LKQSADEATIRQCQKLGRNEPENPPGIEERETRPCEGSSALTFRVRYPGQITNYAASPISISSINLAWPIANGKETSAKLNGVEIYAPDLNPPSATINTGQKVNVAGCSIGQSQTSTLAFIFASNAVTTQNSYIPYYVSTLIWEAK